MPQCPLVLLLQCLTVPLPNCLTTLIVSLSQVPTAPLYPVLLSHCFITLLINFVTAFVCCWSTVPLCSLCCFFAFQLLHYPAASFPGSLSTVSFSQSHYTVKSTPVSHLSTLLSFFIATLPNCFIIFPLSHCPNTPRSHFLTVSVFHCPAAHFLPAHFLPAHWRELLLLWVYTFKIIVVLTYVYGK